MRGLRRSRPEGFQSELEDAGWRWGDPEAAELPSRESNSIKALCSSDFPEHRFGPGRRKLRDNHFGGAEVFTGQQI